MPKDELQKKTRGIAREEIHWLLILVGTLSAIIVLVFTVYKFAALVRGK